MPAESSVAPKCVGAHEQWGIQVPCYLEKVQAGCRNPAEHLYRHTDGNLESFPVAVLVPASSAIGQVGNIAILRIEGLADGLKTFSPEDPS